MANEEVLTVPEVAKRLRISEFSVRNYLRAGRLRGYRPGGTRAGWRVPATELQRFIKGAEEEAKTAREREQFYLLPERAGYRLGQEDIEAETHSAARADEQWNAIAHRILSRMVGTVNPDAVRADFLRGYMRAEETTEEPEH